MLTSQQNVPRIIVMQISAAIIKKSTFHYISANIYVVHKQVITVISLGLHLERARLYIINMYLFTCCPAWHDCVDRLTTNTLFISSVLQNLYKVYNIHTSLQAFKYVLSE